MEQPIEKQLLEKVANGCPHAYKQLYINYYPRLKAFILKLLRDEYIAEEYAQDIFMGIWENRRKLLEIRSFDDYIFRAAKNKCFNHIEHSYVELTYLKSLHISNFIIHDHSYQLKELELYLTAIITKLPPQKKKIFEMSRIQQLSNQEIALLSGITKKTVENHLNYALKEIRTQLKRIGYTFNF